MLQPNEGVQKPWPNKDTEQYAGSTKWGLFPREIPTLHQASEWKVEEECLGPDLVNAINVGKDHFLNVIGFIGAES